MTTLLSFPAAAGDDQTLLTIDDLAVAGLIAPAEAAGLRPVAARYSVAMTPQIAALIDRDAVWSGKREALELVRSVEMSPEQIGRASCRERV